MMDYKERISNLYLILKENFSDDITYTKEKDFLYLECKGVETPKHKDLTLKLKIKYDDLMLNEMAWAYSAGQTADDHYVLRKDTMESIEQALKTIVDREMFNQDYLETLPTNEEAKEEAKEEAITEARNTVYLKVINEIDSLRLGHWKVEFMNSDNDYLLVPVEKGMLSEKFRLTVDKLKDFDTIKMLELKHKLNHAQAYHEITRVKDVLKRLL
jgi:hypothetical protein